jgi:hypothetical protein
MIADPEVTNSRRSVPVSFVPRQSPVSKEKELPVHHKLEEFLDEYLKATGLGAVPPWAKPANCRAVRSCAPMLRTCSNDGSNKLNYQRTIRLTHFGRPVSRIFWKMTAPLKPLNGLPAMPTAGYETL